MDIFERRSLKYQKANTTNVVKHKQVLQVDNQPINSDTGKSIKMNFKIGETSRRKNSKEIRGKQAITNNIAKKQEIAKSRILERTNKKLRILQKSSKFQDT